MNRIEAFLSTRKAVLVLYLAFACAFAAAANSRILRPSGNNHFAYLAQGWLKGSLSMTVPPPHENDWGLVEVLTLRDGRTVKGQFSKTNVDRFQVLGARWETITPDEIVSRTNIRYVTFPPFPAVLFLPFVAIFGITFNDVLFNVLLGAASPVLLFLLLRDLVRRGYSRRTAVDDLWLAGAFAVGSVYFYSTVVGQVWYTAHVVAIPLMIGYTWASLEARRPVIAGLCLGLAYATRTPAAFMFPFFLFEAVRMHGRRDTADGTPRAWPRLRELLPPPLPLIRKLVAFGLPAAAVVAVLLLHNYLRFRHPMEFGHTFLNIVWAERIQRWGLFNYHFLSRNLSAALLLLPRILAKAPFVKVSFHGLSLLVTSPWLVNVVRPKQRSVLAPHLWLTVFTTAIVSLLYHSSGYYQFGYRYSLDYMVFFMVLLAIGGRPLGAFWKSLVLFAFVVNLFGALTFDRHMQFTYDDTFFPHGNN